MFKVPTLQVEADQQVTQRELLNPLMPDSSLPRGFPVQQIDRQIN